MGINGKIRFLQDSLLNVLNESPMPLEVKRIVLQNLLTAVTNAADKEIINEQIEEQSREEEENAENV